MTFPVIVVDLNLSVIKVKSKNKPIFRKIKPIFNKKYLEIEKTKAKMKTVLEELKFIKIFKSNEETVIPHFYIENTLELERNKEYFKDFVYNEDNKYYGLLKPSEIKIMTEEEYSVSRYNRYPWCLWCDITNLVKIENKVFYEVSKPTNRELRILAWNYNKLPKRTKFHFINENNLVCSCCEFKCNKRCIHGDKLFNKILDNLFI